MPLLWLTSVLLRIKLYSGRGGKTLFPHGTRSQKLKSPELVTREPKTKCCARFQGSYNSANMCLSDRFLTYPPTPCTSDVFYPSFFCFPPGFMFYFLYSRFSPSLLMCLSPFRIVLPGLVNIFFNPPSWDFISLWKILPIFPVFGR